MILTRLQRTLHNAYVLRCQKEAADGYVEDWQPDWEEVEAFLKELEPDLKAKGASANG
jgi:hypothetical protein